MKSFFDWYYKKIKDTLDKKLFTCDIFIELQKAHDTVNHEILLDKLHFYGIKVQLIIGSILSWKIGVNLKTLRKADGSVLGPLLFLLYINDLHKSIIHRSVHHFPDDTKVLLVDKGHYPYPNCHAIHHLEVFLKTHLPNGRAKMSSMAVSSNTVLKDHNYENTLKKAIFNEVFVYTVPIKAKKKRINKG